MYTVVRELPPGRTPCARAKSAADFEPASAHRAVRACARGDFTQGAVAIVESPLDRSPHARASRGWVEKYCTCRTAASGAWLPHRTRPTRYTTARNDPSAKGRRA